jgi:hypothetical protein
VLSQWLLFFPANVLPLNLKALLLSIFTVCSPLPHSRSEMLIVQFSFASCYSSAFPINLTHIRGLNHPDNQFWLISNYAGEFSDSSAQYTVVSSMSAQEAFSFACCADVNLLLFSEDVKSRCPSSKARTATGSLW